ncbi:glutamic-type intramembrane protease PrsW [Ammoniphilus sp. CFH 90114]|uniref:glutamic-type intramembrane protease PrsW n=1 Tax=Ammoniphilus sp. CFH 90114 TaxID=2493665 RepID=UPI00100E2A50|nr:glutamic-type intramembrane protease PrsW [Ammoniphilus sp. CFH 90114]RXT13880.1 intramembrane metalloprotease PrsW [Ammoniphilus sp. CFH 90114]
MIATIGASIAPGIALLSYFYLKDRYQTEPLHIVIKTFIFGILLVFPVMVLQYGLQEEIEFGTLGKAFIIAGLIEEFFKWFIVYYTVYKHMDFDDPYDGIVYSVAVSLGFATLENFFYLYSFGIQEALMRALLPVSSHALFGVTMGYYLGRAKFEKSASAGKLLMFYSIMIPAVLHGLYDFILLSTKNHYLWIISPFMAILWLTSLRRIRKVQNKSKMAPF